jgi:tetratricopeptide (TPR) repeat protein
VTRPTCGAGWQPAADWGCPLVPAFWQRLKAVLTHESRVGRLPIGRRLPTCPTYSVAIYVAVLAVLTVVALPAQTLEQAKTLQKERRYAEANEIFRQLVAAKPDNPDYRVAWGRLYLEHWQADVAQQLFEEALKIKADDAGAFLGLALIQAEQFGGKAGELAHLALKSDPHLVEAQELLARLALEDNNDALARDEAHKALEMDPKSVQGKAILATMDWLADKKDSTWDPHEARGYETAAHFFMLNRRYPESIEYDRKAIALDPELYTARSAMAINLMRLGQDEEAYTELKYCWDHGFQDTATKNTLTLMDSYKNFVTIETPHAILKLHKKEADLLRPYFEEEVERAITTYEKKYKMTLNRKVQVEVYPDHEDFAVRTLGMPGLGALGVTFGYAIAMDSPSGRPPGEFHWASTLWHEMSHVFTLTMTNSKVPRWFTEGIAVHEETAANPEWGDRLGPDEIMAVKDYALLPISELDRGFIHPSYPQQVIVSYFQGGKICDFITEKWGWDTILAMLHDYAHGEETPDVIRKELKIEPAEFDKQFRTYVEAATKTPVEHFTEWKDGLKKIAELNKNKDDDGIIKEGLAIRDLYTDYVEQGSIYELLAHSYLEKKDSADAIDELERYAHVGGRNPASLKLLAKELTDAGKKKEAADILDRLNYIYPVDGDLHQKLGELWLGLGNAAGAAREFRAELAYKPIDPAQAHYDLAVAYNENHQPEQSKDELILALEIAPGFKPAQKLLLQLSK